MNDGNRPIMGCCLLALLIATAATARGQETVVLRGRSGGETRVGGRVVDYTGDGLSLQTPDGQTRQFPADQVLRIEAARDPAHRQADDAFDRGRHAEAVSLYQRVLKNEQRAWMRRRIMARLVRCHDCLGQPAAAAELFVLLISSDPRTPHFDCIPLGWLPTEADATLEQAAANWLKDDRPAVRLLGASHALAGRHRGEAVEVLNGLARADDPLLARLAVCQMWRTQHGAADPTRIERLADVIEALPESLRVGPYHVLGQARSAARQPERAALAWLQSAILYPDQAPIAARSLLLAGREIERLGRPEQAIRLYREVIRHYKGQTSSVAEAQAYLRAADSSP